jgi:hypothetical protein
MKVGGFWLGGCDVGQETLSRVPFNGTDEVSAIKIPLI